MKSFNSLLFILFLMVSGLMSASAQTDSDIHEIRLSFLNQKLSEDSQVALRAASAWGAWESENNGWQVMMDAGTELPHRAWGSGIEVQGQGIESKHNHFVENDLSNFGVLIEHLSDANLINKTGLHERVFQSQTVSGYEVLLSQIQTKWRDEKLVMWGLDWWPDAEVPEGTILNDEVLLSSAINGLPLVNSEVTWEGWGILPDDYAEGEFRLVRKLNVRGEINGLLRNYLTWVDAISGRVWLRKNEIVHHLGSRNHETQVMGVSSPNSPSISQISLSTTNNISSNSVINTASVISGVVKAQAHAAYPFEAEESLAMPNLKIELNGNAYYTDENGGFITNETGSLAGVVFNLEGLWCQVYTNNILPSSNMVIYEGYNELLAPGNVKEASAYRSVNIIHDQMNTWLPGFTDLDFPMITNIDVEGECNAFFDGESINFFNSGGGCNPTSLIADVVYHEYGHGINSFFYNSLGATFMNGAMGEGYADIWAMSVNDIAEIGKGFYEDANDGIRRYDLEPKVYPEDLIGEVHNDGEIIAGAWYDTHLLMGADWNSTLSLFIDAYAGLQATAIDGNEGQAFTDVLLDLLQADDDDADLMNGTPNAAAIIEGFAIHGITLFSYATVSHLPVNFVDADTVIEIEAEVDIVFPYNVYLDGVYLAYKLSPNDEWAEVLMDDNSNVFTAIIDGVPAGTVVEYYIKIKDVFGGVSGVTPFASDKTLNANLPYYIIVGGYPILLNDSDEYSDFGNWELGVPSDNATTGEWEEAIPVGSFGEFGNSSTIVAPNQDHTVGFAGYCFLTGVSPGSAAAIGENDVDDGHTTLLSPVIDLSDFVDPVMTYWRWYANAPSGGANPGTDWWQVEISGDGGATWQYLENTLQQDISWRRKAFRVSDHLPLSSEFRMRFIASDSTTVGEFLDGGSLIEAAIDDIILYDIVPPVIGTNDLTDHTLLSISPNPASDVVKVVGVMPNSKVNVFDNRGTLVFKGRTSHQGQIEINIISLPVGLYTIQLRDEKAMRSSLRFEVIR